MDMGYMESVSFIDFRTDFAYIMAFMLQYLSKTKSYYISNFQSSVNFYMYIRLVFLGLVA